MVSIDGTDISAATIDGTDVQEITVDGSVAWTAGGEEAPTSVQNDRFVHYAADDLSLSDGQNVTTWADREGSADLTASSEHPIYKTGGPGSKPYLRALCQESGMSGDIGSSLSPYTVCVVWRSNDPTTCDFGGTYDDQYAFEVNYSSGGAIGRNGRYCTDNQFLYAGANQAICGAAGDGNWHYDTFIQNGANSIIRRDGTQTGSGDPGTRAFGSTITLNGARAEGEIAELIAFDGDYSGTQTLSDAESYLAGKYSL